jgi:hypothetical protein
VAYSLKARFVESQNPTVAGQRPLNNNRGMVFSAQSMRRKRPPLEAAYKQW